MLNTIKDSKIKKDFNFKDEVFVNKLFSDDNLLTSYSSDDEDSFNPLCSTLQEKMNKMKNHEIIIWLFEKIYDGEDLVVKLFLVLKLVKN